MLKTSLQLIMIYCLLSISITWAGAEFSDEPVDQITHPDWFKQSFLDLNEDVADAKQAGKAGIIVFFEQEHCAYCNAVLTNNFGDDAIAQYTQKYFDVIAIDIYGSKAVTDFKGNELTEHDYATKLKAELTPTLDFYDNEKRLVFRLKGYYPPEKFSAALRYVAGKHYLKQRFRDFLRNTATNAHITPLNNKIPNLFENPPYLLDRSHILAELPLMVMFDKANCETCTQLHNSIISQPSIRKLIAQFDAVQLDMWSDTPVLAPSGEKKTAVEWAENLGLFYAPTIVFFDESGTEVYRIDSVVKLRRLSGILRYILSGDYDEEPNYESWKRSQAEKAN